jgi:hypothetical protein
MILLRWIDFRNAFAEDTTPGIDGAPAWPVDRVRADGFDDGFSGIGRPITAFPLTVSCDGQVTSTVDAFHWHLAQRTDDAALQWLSITQSDTAKSGTVTISLTSKCVTDMDLSGATASLNEDHLREILKHCSLYVVRTSDTAIQWVDLLQYTLSAY